MPRPIGLVGIVLALLAARTSSAGIAVYESQWPAALTPQSVNFSTDGNLWIGMCGSHEVRKYSPEGTLLMSFG